MRLASWHAEPPAEDGWDTSRTVDLPLSSGVVRLTAVTAAASGRTLSLAGSGGYRLTVYSRGRAAAATSEPFVGSDVERRLLQVQPRPTPR